MSGLLNVDQALERVLAHFTPLPAEAISLPDALHRVLAEDVIASEDVPPFPNSSMDGFAVRAEDTQGAGQESPVSLTVSMDIPAGASPDRALRRGEAARIMTGAVIPPDADAVVPVEQTDITWTPGSDQPLPARVSIFRAAKRGDNVRPAGEDMQVGQRILVAGTRLRPAEIGVLAALGRPVVPVVRRPRVAILSTGDELVEVDQPLTPGKIRDSNSYTLAALIAANGGVAIRIPTARDTLDDVRRRFKEALDSQPDVILSSAGVSVGAFDVVRTVIDELGQVDFWRINLRPGKPLAFGRVGGVPFFGLPGNPVSAMVTFEVFVRPALLKLCGTSEAPGEVQAVLGEDIHSDGRRSYLRVRLTRDGDHYTARTTGTQSSGALTSMVLADGLLIVPEDVTFAPVGSQLSVRLLRQI